MAAREIVSALKQPWARQWWDIAQGKLILPGVKVRQNAPLVNKHLYELGNADRIYHIVAINRNHNTIIPSGYDQILAEDIVYFMTIPEYIDTVKTLAGKEDIDIQKITIMGGSPIALRLCNQIPRNVNVKLLEINKA
ncbi:MAG: Trk system potassium transporter TrkA, partial [Dysgonamonadaceae bacterium]|nr:Trk system potassium transporter TrkA [Dysgonamonadaceae bacterium]